MANPSNFSVRRFVIWSMLLPLFVIHAQNFTRITTGSVATEMKDSRGCAWGDIDNDGDLDLFVANWRQYNSLFRNNGEGTFTKVTQDPVVSDSLDSYAGSFADYDNDGDLDLFVTNFNYQNNSFYINDGTGSFTRETSSIIVNDGGKSRGCCWGDINNDGYVDLFVANEDNDFLYLNNGNGNFTKIYDGEIVNDYGDGLDCAFADYDSDNDLDLFVANGFDQDNFLYRNNGDGTFERITTGAIVNDGGYSASASWGDYDNDGDPDLFVLNWNYQNSFLYSNNNDGTFTKITTGIIVNDPADSRASSWGDYDNDGDLDLIVVNRNGYNFLYSNNGNGTFIKVTSGPVANDPSDSISSIWGDYDNDGDIDLFITNVLNKSNYLYRNEGNQNNWINISCIGAFFTNFSAIGVKVRLKALINNVETWQYQQISAQNGFASQNSLNVEFGIGNAMAIDSLVVEWPTSDIIQTYTNVGINQFLEISEPFQANPNPLMLVQPLFLIDTLFVGNSRDGQLMISNIRIIPSILTYSITEDPPVDWLEVSPDTGSVRSRETDLITVNFDASNLVVGLYNTHLIVTGNDSTNSMDTVNVILEVAEPPVVAISPDSLHFALNTGQVDSQVMVISNYGAGPLIFNLSDQNILGESISTPAMDHSYIRPEYNIEIPKGQPDWRVGTPQTDGTGGPDLYGYTWIDSDEPGGPVFSWIDISATGIEITGLSDDNYVGPFPLGFSFNFYGNNYTDFYVQSNGLINFDNTYITLSNYQIPLADNYNNLIAWLWDDLNPADPMTHVFYQTMDNMMVILFEHYFEYGSAAWVDAEMIIYSNGNIKIQYDYFDPVFNKLGCTIGIENANGTDGLQVVYNGAYLHDDLALLFSRESQWLSENPASGIVPPGSNMNIQVIADATRMFGGDYLAKVIVNSNDPANPVLELPRVSLAVTGVPVISTIPASLNFDTTFMGLSTVQELQIINDGTDELIISSITSTNQVFSVDTTHFNLGPLSNLLISVSFYPPLTGSYEGWIIVESNDSVNPLDSTRVMGVAIEGPTTIVVPNFQNPVFVWLGDSVEVSINLANAGGNDLLWSASTAWLPMVLDEQIQSPVYQIPEIMVHAEAAPKSAQTTNRINLDAIWDLQFSFDVQIASGALGNTGAEFDGTYYYSTRWGSNLLHKYDITGTLVEEFSIPGVSGLRELAFDGTYMYGGTAANTIYMMDFVTKTLITTIPSPVTVRSIAYDSDNDAFWVGNWSTDLALVSRAGSTLAIIPVATHGLSSMYGTAYDNWSDGGPYLWVFDQSVTGDQAIIHQIQISTGLPTGVSHNVINEFPASSPLAGGLFIAEGIVSGKVSLGGLAQGTPDMYFVYELTEDRPTWIRAMVNSGVVIPGDNFDLPVRIYDLDQGRDSAYVVIQTNDPSAPVFNIEVYRTILFVGLEDRLQMPTRFDIAQNYPNPFNPITTIKYQLPKVSDVSLVIYNVLGQKVRTLLNGQIEAGYHSVVWDGRNEEGQSVGSGIYLYRFEAGDFMKIFKLVVLK